MCVVYLQRYKVYKQNTISFVTVVGQSLFRNRPALLQLEIQIYFIILKIRKYILWEKYEKINLYVIAKTSNILLIDKYARLFLVDILSQL